MDGRLTYLHLVKGKCAKGAIMFGVGIWNRSLVNNFLLELVFYNSPARSRFGLRVGGGVEEIFAGTCVIMRPLYV